MRWSVLPASAITQALADTGRELVALTTPWAENFAYMFRDRFEQFAESAVQRAPERISQIGEVLPTVMIDGSLIGIWSWNKAARRVEPALIRGRTSQQQRRLVRARVEMLSGTLLRGWQNANGTGGTGTV